MTRSPLLLRCIVVCIVLLTSPCVSLADDTALEKFLPGPGFAPGWVFPEKPNHYNAGNLYKYINGEAELFMPYGFKTLVSAFYRKGNDPASGIVADIYQMGSPLDAFGIYSSYMNPGEEKINIGAQGFIEESQLMFYKDRHFVRLSVSGTIPGAHSVLMACAEAIDRKLPGKSQPPAEIEVLNIPEVDRDTIRYIARSVLGYTFFPKGLTADAKVGGETARIFVIYNGSAADSAFAFRQYVEYLGKSGIRIDETKLAEGSIEAMDPLYKGTCIKRSESYIVGIVRLKDPSQGVPVIHKVLSRIRHRLSAHY